MTGPTSAPDTVPAASSADRRDVPLPDTLQSPRTKLVYLYLRTTAGAGMAELKRSLGMQALALYPILDALVEKGLVERDDDAYVVTGTPDE
ncbi:MAG: hypothetical protein ABEH78_01305 [Haloferacaceae archaeon]